jgi:dipeptidase E
MAKLVLYSDQLLPETARIDQRLFELIGKDRPAIGYIPSCGDPTRFYYEDRRAFYAQYGASMPVYFALDQEYGPGRLSALLACDAIHLTGGNTFYFLHWLKQRQLLLTLREYVMRGGVLVGVSAGAILMTPNIETALWCNDEPIEGDIDWSALGLAHFAFAPHFGSSNSNARMADLVSYSHQHHMTVYGCPDGAGIVVNDGQVECFGDIVAVVENAVENETTRSASK